MINIQSMTSRNNIIALIEKCLQKVIAQEDIENNVNLINENIKDLELDVPVREFLLYLIKTIKSLSESKSNFSNYPFTETNNSHLLKYQEESKKNTEDIIRKLTDEINKIISENEIKDFELIIKNTFNLITEYMNKKSQINELLFSKYIKKSIEILKSENYNPDLNNFKVKNKTELKNKEGIKKSNEELKNDMKEIKLLSDINSEKITKLKKDNNIIVDENQKYEEINDEHENLKNSIQQIKNEIVQTKNYIEKIDNKTEKIITEIEQIKSDQQKIGERILNMEKQINELYNIFQENEYNNQLQNFYIYNLQREVEELKKERLEFQNDYLLNFKKNIDEIIEKRCEKEFNKYFKKKNNNK